MLEALGIAADLYGSYLGSQGAKSQNKTALTMQRRQTQYDYMMDNSAVQRRTKDLRAAGINPILAAGQAAGSTPAPSANIVNEKAPLQEGLSKAASTALAARRLSSEVENMAAQNQNIHSSTALNEAAARASAADALLKTSTARQTAVNTKLLELTMPGAKNQADFEGSVMGPIKTWTSNLLPSAGAMLGIGASAKGLSLLKKAQPRNASVIPPRRLKKLQLAD